MTSSSMFLNTSVCSTATKKPTPTRTTMNKVSNKENAYNENSKGTGSKLA